MSISDKVSIVSQLCEIYLNKETWFKNKLSPAESFKYFSKLVGDGNIAVYRKNGKVLGYYECWYVTKPQMTKFLKEDKFCAYTENITDGNIAYLADAYIDKDYRNNGVIRHLKKEFFKQAKDCSYFAGNEMAKRDGRLRIFNRRKPDAGAI